MPPEVGSFRVETHEWGTEKSGEKGVLRSPIPTRECSKEELGLERGDSTKMFELQEDQINWFFPTQKWLCIDKDETFLQSTWSSPMARML